MPKRANRAIYSYQRLYGTRTYIPTGDVFVTSNGAESKIIAHQDVATYTNNPNWKQQIVRATDATGAYTRTGGWISNARFFGEAVRPSIEVYSHNGSLHAPMPGVLFDTSLDAGLRDLALKRFKNKLRDHIGQAALAEPVAEAHKLGGLVRQAARLGADVLKELIKLRKNPGKKSARSLARLASRIWLSYSFGIKPLVNDINNAITSIQDYLDREDHIVRISAGSGRDGIVGLKQAATVYVGALHILNGSDQGSYFRSYKYIGSAKVDVRSSNHYGLMEHLGLGLGDVIPVLWELTYASWIADYFVNIGEYLEDTFEALPGTLVYLNLNTLYVGQATRTFETPNLTSSTRHTSMQVGQSHLKYFSFSREKLAALPHAGLRVKTVDEIGKNAVNKLLNLAAVLGTRK